MSTIQDGAQYIKHCRELGFSDAEIITALKKANWQETDIQAALVATPKATTHNVSKIILYIIVAVVVVAILTVAGLAAYIWFTK